MIDNVKFYYLTSYEQINIQLYLRETYSKYRWILVVDSDDLEELCKTFLWDYERIHIDHINLNYINSINLFYLFNQRLRIEAQVNKIIQKYQNKEIFYSVRCVGISSIYLISKLKNKNKIIFVDPEKEKNYITIKYAYLSLFIKKIIYNLLFDLNLEINSLRGEMWICACKSFAKNSIERIQINRNISHLIYNLSIPKTKKKKIFIMGHSLKVDSGLCNKSEIIEFYKYLLSRDDIYFKPHPNSIAYERNKNSIKYFDSDLDKELNKKIDHKYRVLPIEVLRNNISTVISFSSSTLSTLADYNIQSISVMDLFTKTKKWDHSEYKIKLLKKSRNKIKFVKSIEELSKLIS